MRKLKKKKEKKHPWQSHKVTIYLKSQKKPIVLEYRARKGIPTTYWQIVGGLILEVFGYHEIYLFALTDVSSVHLGYAREDGKGELNWKPMHKDEK